MTAMAITHRPIENVLHRLPKVRQVGPGKWIACCPAHDDRSPSLSIRETTDGKVLLKCWAGCPTASVLGAAGLGWRDLFPSEDRDGPAFKSSRVLSGENDMDRLANLFEEACLHTHRRLAVLFRVVGHIFAVYGLEVTPDEAEWVRELPHMEFVLDLLLSDNPDEQFQGLKAARRWLH